MPRNKHLKFMDEHNLQDALLREFVTTEQYEVALGECIIAIDKRKADILKLTELKLALKGEVERDES